MKIDTGSIEWIAAPVLLAYFSAKGWKTEDPWWFRKLPLWRPVLRIAATTLLSR